MKEKKSILILLLTSSVVVLLLTYLLLTRQMTIPFLYSSKGGQLWQLGVVNTTSPLEIDTNSIHWIPKEITNQFPVPGIMADPFIVIKDSIYYIFYEEKSGKRNSNHGNICVLESCDGKTWKYLGYVLDAPFHLSWPNVFEYEGEYYMIPERGTTLEMAIYKAIDFPMKWKKEAIIRMGEDYADPILYRYNEVWYLFVWDKQVLSLYYNDNFLEDDWTLHSSSPVVKGSGSRPAGQICTINDEPYMFLHMSEGSYGTGVYAYMIDSISITDFSMHRIEKPILWKYGEGCAKDGMHTLNYVQMPDSSYLCVVDGTIDEEPKPWKWSWKNLPEFHWFWHQVD